jgi:hypothetical protein
MKEEDPGFDVYDYPFIEVVEESAGFAPEITNRDTLSSSEVHAVQIDRTISALTGLPVSAPAEVKYWTDQADFTITYKKNTADRVCTFSQISIALIRSQFSDGRPRSYIKASYQLDSHGERTARQRETGRVAETQFAFFDESSNRPFYVLPTWPTFWLKCGTNHLRTLETEVDPAFYSKTYCIRLWISEGEFYKC